MNSMPLVGDMLRGQMVILRGDVQRFALSAPSISGRMLAKRAGVSEGTVRSIRSDEWTGSDLTLRSMEKGWHDHELWQPKKTLDWRVNGNAEGYILRRLVDPWSSSEFGAISEAWRSRSNDESFIESVLDMPVVSVVDVSAEDPLDYLIEKHAESVIKYTGLNKNRITFRQNRTALYQSAVTRDYKECTKSDTPRAFDIFWQVQKFNEGSFYRRLLLPCGGKVVSVSLIQKWRFPSGWG